MQTLATTPTDVPTASYLRKRVAELEAEVRDTEAALQEAIERELPFRRGDAVLARVSASDDWAQAVVTDVDVWPAGHAYYKLFEVSFISGSGEPGPPARVYDEVKAAEADGVDR